MVFADDETLGFDGWICVAARGRTYNVLDEGGELGRFVGFVLVCTWALNAELGGKGWQSLREQVERSGLWDAWWRSRWLRAFSG